MQHQHAPRGGTRRQQVSRDAKNLLEELKSRQEKLDQGMDVLNAELHKWVQAVHSQLDEVVTQFGQVQKEITNQAELSDDVSSLSNKASPQEAEGDRFVLIDKEDGPKDTDC